MQPRTHLLRLPGRRFLLLPVVLVLALAGALCLLGLDPLLAAGDTKLRASDGAAGDRFGWSVAVDGNTAVIGAPFDDDKGADSGAAYVFVHDGTSWNQQAKLTAPDGAALDYFGFSVAVKGDTALVGVPFDDDKGTNSGSVRVFTRSGTTWTQQAKLLASDGEAHENLGESVSLDGDTALLSAQRDDDKGTWSGAAYVFVRSDTTWTQQAKLLASDGAAENFFGASVSLSGDTALIGAPYNDNKGAAYAFVRTGDTWNEQAKLTASDGETGDGFGYSVALKGDIALIGAIGDDDKGLESGSAYAFKRAFGIWPPKAKLTASDGAAFDFFGTVVTLGGGGDQILIGAPYDDDKGTDSGSAYEYVSHDGGETWTPLAKQTAADGQAGDLFGSSLSLSGNNRIALVGAPGDDDLGNESGAAYALDLGGNEKVSTRLTVPNVTTGIGQKALLKATLKRDDTLSALFDKDITFKIDGEPVGTKTTNLNGLAKLNYPISESTVLGNHTLTAEFAGDDTYAPSIVSAILKVNKGAVTIKVTPVSSEAGSTVTLKANLKNKSGKPLSDRELRFMLTIDDLAPVILGTATTDSNGDASLSDNIPPEMEKGTHTIVVTFAGDSLYKPGKGKGKLTVN